jgi:hypothetical protein
MHDYVAIGLGILAIVISAASIGLSFWLYRRRA